jgi:hypothetical protein
MKQRPTIPATQGVSRAQPGKRPRPEQVAQPDLDQLEAAGARVVRCAVHVSC